jgi:hypothetical protein
MALSTMRTVIDLYHTTEEAKKKIPSQIAIILPPAEGEDVREDKRDEAFRANLEQHYIEELS